MFQVSPWLVEPNLQPQREPQGPSPPPIVPSCNGPSLKLQNPTPTSKRQTPRTARNIPEFKVAPEEALELLMASNFLDT